MKEVKSWIWKRLDSCRCLVHVSVYVQSQTDVDSCVWLLLQLVSCCCCGWTWTSSSPEMRIRMLALLFFGLVDGHGHHLTGRNWRRDPALGTLHADAAVERCDCWLGRREWWSTWHSFNSADDEDEDAACTPSPDDPLPTIGWQVAVKFVIIII